MKTKKNQRGRKATLYESVPLHEALPAMLAYVAPHVLRAVLVRQFPDVLVTAEHLADLLRDTGATPDDIAAIDTACRDLYAQDADRRREAFGEYERRMAILRTKYSVRALLSPSPAYPVQPLRFAACDFTNAKTFLDSFNALDADQHGGQRDASARWRVQNLTGRCAAAHRASSARVGLLAVPQYDDHALDDDSDVLTQAERVNPRAYQRGAMRLVADTGETITLSDQRAETFDYEDWIDQHGGASRVTLRVILPSVEKRDTLLDDHERAKVDAFAAAQAERSGKRWEGGQGQAIPAPDLTRRWLIQQGVKRAGLFGLQALPEDKPRLWVTAYGEMLEYGDVWRGIVTSVKPDKRQGGDMATFTAHSDPDIEREPVQPAAREHEPRPARTAQRPPRAAFDRTVEGLNRAAKVTRADARAHTCECGRLADVLGLWGWQCVECAGVHVGANHATD